MKLKPDEIFAALAENGLDLIERAATELDSGPKYSVIHFAAGVEVLFKARLMKEHWALIFRSPEKASIANFTSGDMQSVGIVEAIKRLEAIAGQSFDKHQVEAFAKALEHRNRVLHFHHASLSKKAKPEAIAEIAAEQIKAWFYLERMLAQPWKTSFKQFAARVRKIDSAFQANAVYLKGKFEALRPGLDAVKCDKCPACGFAAYEMRADGMLRTANCHVCGARETWLTTKCPTCGQELKFADATGSKCLTCGAVVTLDGLMGPGGAFEDMDGEGVAYCMECQFMPRSVVNYNEGFICLSCFSEFESIGACGYCTEPLAGGSEDDVETFISGCLLCDGKWGEDED